MCDLESDTFDISYSGKKCIVGAAFEKVCYKDMTFLPDEYTEKEYNQSCEPYCHSMSVTYKKQSAPVESITLKFSVNSKGVTVEFAANAGVIAYIGGAMQWGEDSFAMSSVENSHNLRAAIGPAASAIDNMLFDRQTDSAVSVTGGKSFRLSYDWDKKAYDFSLLTGVLDKEHKFHIKYEKNIMSDAYSIEYAPINKNGVYKKPPSGWMTWYAVGFNACEEKVLENAKWQSENLKKYGADTVWVDWEWYHKDLSGSRDDGVNTFVPDPEKYPHGLKFMSDKIRELGLEPALWVGYTIDSTHNEYTEKNPEIILVDKPAWCGKYHYDLSHPKYLNEFLPKALKNVSDWGYRVIKYDTIPNCITAHEMHHENMYNPELTTREAYRNMIKKTRECVGEDVYMLSCAGVPESVLWAADCFDAARVGNDIFEWEEFIKEGISCVMDYYPLHNVVLYNDPDNLVLREEFNTYNQAASRVYFVAMLGMPMTFGDVFRDLPDERVDLIKKSLPIMDIHPMDIKKHSHDNRVLTINLNINKPYEEYTVLDVFNMQEADTYYELRLESDLYLDRGEYHIYDFTNDEYMGIAEGKLMLELAPCQSRIFAIRKKEDRPQVVSTSRHITQGAAEIRDMSWRDNALSIKCDLVANDEYKISVYVPDGYKPLGNKHLTISRESDNIYTYKITPDRCGEYEFRLQYSA